MGKVQALLTRSHSESTHAQEVILVDDVIKSLDQEFPLGP